MHYKSGIVGKKLMQVLYHQGEWYIEKNECLDIFIQHQYPVLTDTYKRNSTIKLWTINKRELQDIVEGQNVV